MGNQKGLVQRIERMLEDGVGDAFARVFGGSIVPEEIEALLRRQADDGLEQLPRERFLAPNEYVIALSPPDFQKVSADGTFTTDAFATHLAGYIREQGWQTYGEVVVRFEQADNLHTGQYRARAVVNPDAYPRPSTPTPGPAESNHAYNAEPGVPGMTDNSYRGQGRDEYYDDQYGRPQEGTPEPPRPAYPDQGGYDPYAPGMQGGGYPPRPAYPDQGGYDPYLQGGQGGYGPGGQGGYGAPQYGPPPGYGAPQYGPPQGYAPPAAPAPDYGYGRPRHEEPGYGGYEQPRPAYPDQGYQQPGYGGGYARPDYGQQPGYGGYDQGGYAPPPPAPAAPEYDYGQQGYGGYAPAPAQPEYQAPAGVHGVTLVLDDGSGRTYQLREGANVIGRGQDAQFRLPDTGVSRRHLEIRWDGQTALLQDLNSTNGTTVNNAPVQEWQLADGDVIRVGHSEIIVRLH